MNFNEKRRSPRVMKRLEVSFIPNGERTAITSNISETGLFIRTQRGVDEGGMLDLRIKPPNTADLLLEVRGQGP